MSVSPMIYPATQFSLTILVLKGINPGFRSFHHLEVSGANLQIDSFEELALPLFDQLYNFAHWLTQDRTEAEDLVQETYAKALRGFASFQACTNFRALMYRILRNSFLNTRTGLKTMVPFEEEEHDLAESSTPESFLIEQA